MIEPALPLLQSLSWPWLLRLEYRLREWPGETMKARPPPMATVLAPDCFSGPSCAACTPNIALVNALAMSPSARLDDAGAVADGLAGGRLDAFLTGCHDCPDGQIRGPLGQVVIAQQGRHDAPQQPRWAA